MLIQPGINGTDKLTCSAVPCSEISQVITSSTNTSYIFSRMTYLSTSQHKFHLANMFFASLDIL